VDRQLLPPAPEGEARVIEFWRTHAAVRVVRGTHALLGHSDKILVELSIRVLIVKDCFEPAASAKETSARRLRALALAAAGRPERAAGAHGY
jgi:hypothetical protein